MIVSRNPEFVEYLKTGTDIDAFKDKAGKSYMLIVEILVVRALLFTLSQKGNYTLLHGIVMNGKENF